MKRAALVLAAVVAGTGIAAPAQALTTKDIYMVKNVQRADDFYVGEFVVVRKGGTQVVGARGAFYSEYGCLSGTVANGIFDVQYWDDYGNPAGTWVRPWVNGHVKGWRKVTWSQFMNYSGGFKPGRAINYCIGAIP